MVMANEDIIKKTVKLEELELYLDNPRFSSSEGQQEALFKMVDEQEDKILELANDIAQFGIMEELVGYLNEKGDGYTIAEGNRRLTALILLNNPELIKEHNKRLYSGLININKNENVEFNSVQIAIYPSEDDERLIHYLEVRHLGEQKGVGLVRWNSTQKDRFSARISGKQNTTMFFDTLKNKGILTEKQIEGVTKTNWERILRPYGLNFFGLKKENGKYILPENSLDEFKTKIQTAADMLCDKTVAEVYDQEKIEIFFANVQEKIKSLPDNMALQSLEQNDISEEKSGTSAKESTGEFNSKKSTNEISIMNIDNVPFADGSKKENGLDDIKTGCVDINEDTSSKGKSQRAKPPRNVFDNSKTVIPNGIRLRSRNTRISKIIKELQTLEVVEYPNACGCLLRALIELSAKEYLEYNGLEKDATKKEFDVVINSALGDMYNKKIIAPDLQKNIKEETNKGCIRLLFNGYMHNTEVYPSAIIIQEVFKVFYPFIEKCLT